MVCPEDIEVVDGTTLRTPIFVTVMWGVIVVIALLFSVITVVKFNSVDVFGKRVRTAHISNNFWIVYFVLSALRASVDVLRFDYSSDLSAAQDIFDAYMVVDVFSTCALLLALNFQRKHRSRKSSIEEQPPVRGQINGASGSPVRCPPDKRKWLSEILIVTVSILHLSIAIGNFALPTDVDESIADAMHWTLFGFVVFVRVLIVLSGAFIAFRMHRICRPPHRMNVADDGPSLTTRICLMVGVIVSATVNLPPSVWAKFLPNECVFYIATPYDFIQIFEVVALVMYFIVVRSEFKRNMEECIWTTVSKIQDSWDYTIAFN